ALARRARQQIAITGRDLPVNPAYVTNLKSNGATVLYTSKWFNGAVVLCDSARLQQLMGLPFVKSTFTLNRYKPASAPHEKDPVTSAQQRTTASRKDYGISFKQADMIGATAMHDAGFRGEGMTIAVFDSGFPGVNQLQPFAHLYQNNQIKGTFDFVDRDNSVYEKNSHGTMTFSTMGAYQLGTFIGTAYKANYYLFITEDVNSEHPIEEVNWLLAAEYADSAGVDVINSSLGYSTFDQPSQNYTYADMNGRNAISTRAADFAAATGMLVVTSAGNEGQFGWRFITAPADADSVLTVGAVDSLGNKAGFSSFGPTSDGRIKPNLVAQGQRSAVVFPTGMIATSNGTSFSSPILCGMAAGFWQANPNLTNLEVISILQQSASRANNPDNNIGYGIPNFLTAQQIVKGPEPGKGISYFPNPLGRGPFTIRFDNKAFAGEVKIEIYDRLGRLVEKETHFKVTGEDLEVLPVGAVSAGLYFMNVSWSDQNKTFRLIRLP
ncbi:MAG TPA: S8 family serine peptidase, partial [Adhaeribacter sp.]|nr:S8 family serine peptidase [Adhaeribacter sp.]